MSLHPLPHPRTCAYWPDAPHCQEEPIALAVNVDDDGEVQDRTACAVHAPLFLSDGWVVMSL